MSHVPMRCWRSQGWESPLVRAGLCLTVSHHPQGRCGLGVGGQGHSSHPEGHQQPLTTPWPCAVEGSVSVSGVLHSSGTFRALICLLCKCSPCSCRASAARDGAGVSQCRDPPRLCPRTQLPTCQRWAGVLQEGHEGPAQMLLLGPCATAAVTPACCTPLHPIQGDPQGLGGSACQDTYQAPRAPPCTGSRCRMPGGTCWPSRSGWSPGRAAWGCPAHHTGR